MLHILKEKKKKMKKTAILLTALLMTGSLSACSGKDDSNKSEGDAYTGSPLLRGITSDNYRQTCLIYSDTADAQKVGLVNYTTGEIILPCQYDDHTYRPIDGTGEIQLIFINSEEEKSAAINLLTGEITELSYTISRNSDYSEDCFCVVKETSQGKRYGVVDEDGKVIIPVESEEAIYFYDTENGYMICENDGNNELCDKEGKSLLEKQYNAISKKGELYFAMAKSEDKSISIDVYNEKLELLSTTGSLIGWTGVDGLYLGLAYSEDILKQTLYDESLNELISGDNVDVLADGKVICDNEVYSSDIKKLGDIITTMGESSYFYCYEKEDGKVGLINKYGKSLGEADSDSDVRIDGDMAALKKSDGWHIYSCDDGELTKDAIPAENSFAHIRENIVVTVNESGKLSAYSPDGKLNEGLSDAISKAMEGKVVTGVSVYTTGENTIIQANAGISDQYLFTAEGKLLTQGIIELCEVTYDGFVSVKLKGSSDSCLYSYETGELIGEFFYFVEKGNGVVVAQTATETSYYDASGNKLDSSGVINGIDYSLIYRPATENCVGTILTKDGEVIILDEDGKEALRCRYMSLI